MILLFEFNRMKLDIMKIAINKNWLLADLIL